MTSQRASEAQRLATIPERTFEKFKREAQSADQITVKAALKLAPKPEAKGTAQTEGSAKFPPENIPSLRNSLMRLSARWGAHKPSLSVKSPLTSG